MFNEGYSASSGDVADAARSVRPKRSASDGCWSELLPEPEAMGLLALMLLHESRRAARTDAGRRADPDGRAGSVAVESSLRSMKAPRWSERALASRRIGPTRCRRRLPRFTPKRRRASQTDWTQIVGLLRRPGACGSIAGGRSEPRRRCRDARWPAGRPRADRRDPRPRRSRRLPAGALGPRRSLPAPREDGRSARRIGAPWS